MTFCIHCRLKASSGRISPAALCQSKVMLLTRWCHSFRTSSRLQVCLLQIMHKRALQQQLAEEMCLLNNVQQWCICDLHFCTFMEVFCIFLYYFSGNIGMLSWPRQCDSFIADFFVMWEVEHSRSLWTCTADFGKVRRHAMSLDSLLLETA